MSKTDIYGTNPDGGATEAGNEALRVMKGLGITGTEAKSTGKETSRSDLESLKKGDK
jgi:hypothetical protein